MSNLLVQIRESHLILNFWIIFSTKEVYQYSVEPSGLKNWLSGSYILQLQVNVTPQKSLRSLVEFAIQ